MAELLKVKDLRTWFYRPDGVVKAVDGISYSLAEGESLGIVGESGSGKSVSVLSLLKLLKNNAKIESGEAFFNGKDLLKLDKESLRQVRGKEIAMIFQDPMTSLNPSYKISKQMVEPLVWHNLMQGTQADDHAIKQLDHVGIPEARKRFSDYPYQFSGGMRQRVMIAMSLTCKPKLLIADEPTTALDVTVRSQILNLLQDMKAELGMSVIIITHDFGIATNFCDRIIVMYAGKIVETAPTKVFVSGSRHPYSQGLLNSTLEVDSAERTIKPIPGNPPNMLAVPPGCSFHPRCEYVMDVCRTVIPPLLQLAENHCVACHLVKGDRPCE